MYMYMSVDLTMHCSIINLEISIVKIIFVVNGNYVQKRMHTININVVRGRSYETFSTRKSVI